MVKDRRILFLGNLSYRTTKEEIVKFLECIGDVEVRLQTEKSGKSKGFAFVEYSTNTQFQKLLKLHHSVLGGRKINVEMTAGGGGGSKKRKEKIQRKNHKIQKFRQKIFQNVKKTKKPKHLE